MQDFFSIVTSFTARLYGKRRTKRVTEKLINDLKMSKRLKAYKYGIYVNNTQKSVVS